LTHFSPSPCCNLCLLPSQDTLPDFNVVAGYRTAANTTLAALAAADTVNAVATRVVWAQAGLARFPSPTDALATVTSLVHIVSGIQVQAPAPTGPCVPL
jgi:hypothetical protein